jgi:DNA-binding PadR family transcriptional regulator
MAKAGGIPRLTATETLILELLGSGEMYGLQLVTTSRGRLKRGSVYVLLGRMEEKGLVEARAEAKAAHAGLPRRLYRATGLGRRVLAAWAMMAAALSAETV